MRSTNDNDNDNDNDNFIKKHNVRNVVIRLFLSAC